MYTRIITTAALMLLFVGTAVAQQPAPPPPAHDPIGEAFFPPELVMQNQQAIGLTDAQKESLKTELRKAQVRFTELQWQLSDQAEKLAALVKQETLQEGQILAQLDNVLNVEREIKRTQLSLVIQIRNALTPEQRARLTELRTKPGNR